MTTRDLVMMKAILLSESKPWGKDAKMCVAIANDWMQEALAKLDEILPAFKVAPPKVEQTFTPRQGRQTKRAVNAS